MVRAACTCVLFDLWVEYGTYPNILHGSLWRTSCPDLPICNIYEACGCGDIQTFYAWCSTDARPWDGRCTFLISYPNCRNILGSDAPNKICICEWAVDRSVYQRCEWVHWTKANNCYANMFANLESIESECVRLKVKFELYRSSLILILRKRNVW